MVPSDEAIVVERFRDEIGDWRLCVLSPWGGRVHAAWGLALSAKIRDERELEADAIWSDDGIVIHLPDADEPPPARPGDDRAGRARGPGHPRAVGLGPVRRSLPRERLALPADPPRLARQAHAALAAAAQVPEPARGRPRLPPLPGDPRDLSRGDARRPRPARAARSSSRDLHSRKITMVEVETPTASPFASSLLFDYVATYMYEGDTPNAERRAAALALDRDLLARAAGPGGAARADRPGGAGGGRRAAPAPDRGGARQGPRRPAADPPPARRPDRRGMRAAHRGGLLGEHRCWRSWSRSGGPRWFRVAGEERYIAAEDAGPLPRRARRAAAGRPAGELPGAGRRRAASRWCGATPPPTCPSRPASSPTATASTPAPALKRARAAGRPWSAASCCPGGTEREWCDADVLRRLRRASLARLRQEVEATDRGSSPASCRAGRTSTRTAARARARPPARGAGPAAGRGADAEDLGARRAAAPARRLQPHLARRALHQRRAGLDRRRARWAAATARSPSTSARTSGSAGPPPGQRQDRSARGRGPRRHPRAARRRAPASGSTCSSSRARPRSSTRRSGTWPGLARSPTTPSRPLRAPRLRAAQRAERGGPPLRPPPRGRGGDRDRPLVADRAAVRGRALRRAARARAGRADARAPWDRHPGDRDRRGDPRRLRLDLRRAPEPGAARDGPARLLRRGPRRRPVRPAGRGRAAAQPAAGRGRAPGAGRDRPGQPLWRDPLLAQARGPATPRADRGRLRDAPRRRAAALRRAGRQGDPAAAAARGRANSRRRWPSLPPPRGTG